MQTIRVFRLETCTNRVSVEVEVPDDYKLMDAADFDDLVTDLACRATTIDEEVIDVIDTTAWKEVTE